MTALFASMATACTLAFGPVGYVYALQWYFLWMVSNSQAQHVVRLAQ